MQWVADEIGEVEVEIRNPLRAPIEVTDMTILHDGAEMEANPASFKYCTTYVSRSFDSLIHVKIRKEGVR